MPADTRTVFVPKRSMTAVSTSISPSPVPSMLPRLLPIWSACGPAFRFVTAAMVYDILFAMLVDRDVGLVPPNTHVYAL